MAGIYLHIPFCRQACHYCDFHFSTSLTTKPDTLQAMRRELLERLPEANGQKIHTIYFGGGTPSLLEPAELMLLLDTVLANYDVASDAEITLEANPDDLTKARLEQWQQTPVNRFSIGVQSFREDDLKYMRRVHTVQQADYSIKLAQDKGFSNLTIDLIYGTPTLPDTGWKENLEYAFGLQVPHISAYALTVEENTPLFHLIRRQKIQAVDEVKSAAQFEILMEQMADAGYEQYEISNFSKPGFRSRHNSSYWQGIPYLGIGPSAHSYDGEKRRWNMAHNMRYTQAVLRSEPFYEEEVLTDTNRYNEYVMISLRLIEGLSLAMVEQKFGIEFRTHLLRMLENIPESLYTWKNDIICLTNSGKLQADRIASELFVTQD